MRIETPTPTPTPAPRPTPRPTPTAPRRRAARLMLAVASCGLLTFGTLATAPAAFAASTAASSAAAWSPIAEGENSANALSVQHLLNAAGYPVIADGVFGPATADAVRAFQSDRGLPVDGIVGAHTGAALIVPLQSGDSGDAVLALQVQLNKTGAGLAVDGVFGADTHAAVVNSQTASGLTADGIVGPLTWQALVGSGSGATPSPGQPGETFATLNEEQLSNVRVIIAEGKAAGVPEYGWVVAIAAAMQESRLRNLPGGDRDSVGLFQQRPSVGWGDPAQLIDPSYAARAFYGGPNSPTPNPGLLDIEGWQNMTVTQAAQAVQVSAYPDAYAQWEPLAREAVASEG